MAIAIDATSSGTGTAGTTVTVPHTCTGSNLVLIVVAGATDGVSTPTCTYNGVSMTQGAIRDVASEMFSIVFYLVSPDTGTHDIVLTKGSGDEFGVMGISFTGAGGVSATATNSGGSLDTTATVTVNTATTGNGYVVAGGTNNVAAITVTYTGSGAEFANVTTASQRYMAARTAFASGADVTESWTKVASKWSLCGIEVYEASTTSIKTVDGLAVASVKTVDGLAIASVKNINGLA